ncbi:hypothetical protein E6C27_scaffold102G00790 [Cucumis melo var. makuwa]|uniref:Uncharacterized protein n=1 Tax=Cucumis melo var. makuwa TaxID=1194695 RepID=A0A5A7UDY8_CUCMM|nr:hypothetical protein E6C27_scaffold102G00790 [Cucumis melo var. makuwa]
MREKIFLKILEVRSQSGCIIGGIRFHTLEHDYQYTAQNSGVKVVGEGSGGGRADNNFYGVLDEVLHVKYPLGRCAWLSKYKWFNTDNNKNHRTHVELGYKLINTSPFLFAEEPVIFALRHIKCFTSRTKNGTIWKLVQVVQNKRIWDVPEGEDIENEQFNVLEIDVEHRVDEHIEDDTLCRVKVDPTVVERPDVHHVAGNFIDDDDEQLSSPLGGLSDDELYCLLHVYTLVILLYIYSLHEPDMYLNFDDALDTVGGSSSETSALPKLRVGAICTSKREDLNIDRPRKGQTYLATCRSIQLCHCTWKELTGDNHRHFNQFNALKEAHENLPTRWGNEWKIGTSFAIIRSNQGLTWLLERSSLTTIEMDPCRFFNDNAISLKNVVFMSNLSSYLEKHTPVELAKSNAETLDPAHSEDLQRLSGDEIYHDRNLAKTAQQMEEITKMIEEMSQAERTVNTLGV